MEELKGPALAALEWVERYGDRDGDGFLEYERRTPRGLENQSWKDSGDSQRFADGRIAAPPIAPVEVQGYALRRAAEDGRARPGRLGRRTSWRTGSTPTRTCSQRRFDEAFWIEERQTYALALDGSKKRVDSLCSNIGHLLWSGIVPEGRRAAVAAALTGESLWSGWGVRTMGTSEGAYNPLSYHNGTVWPHDTALAAWGLARAGYWEESARLARSLIEASSSFDYSLPGGVRGIRARRDGVSDRLPDGGAAAGVGGRRSRPLPHAPARTAPRPRYPPPRQRRPVAAARWLAGTRLDGVRAFGETWTVEVGERSVAIEKRSPT